jgi:ABC-type branched-subunit amino acid transport system substrate-binding protein
MLAPNYQSGRDQIAGFKRLYKGSVAGEVYTQLNQPDYSAELAQLQAAAPDVVYVFYPGGMGVNFIKQYKQAGLWARSRWCRPPPSTAPRCRPSRTRPWAPSRAPSGA